MGKSIGVKVSSILFTKNRYQCYFQHMVSVSLSTILFASIVNKPGFKCTHAVICQLTGDNIETKYSINYYSLSVYNATISSIKICAA